MSRQKDKYGIHYIQLKGLMGVARRNGQLSQVLSPREWGCTDSRNVRRDVGRVVPTRVGVYLCLASQPSLNCSLSLIHILWLRDGLVGKDPMSALRCYPWEPRSERSVPSQIRLVVECDPEEGQRRMDVPICYEQGRRSFAPRYVKNLWFDPAKWLLSAEEVGECTCQD